MRSYGYDDSPVLNSTPGDYRPNRGLLIGLFIAFIVSSLACGAVGFVFFKYVAYAELEKGLPEIIANSKNFLVILLMLNTVVMVCAGRAVGCRAAGKEGAYGIILASLVTLISLFLFKGYDGFRLFPAWFNVAVFVTMYGAIYLGAKSVEVQSA